MRNILFILLIGVIFQGKFLIIIFPQNHTPTNPTFKTVFRVKNFLYVRTQIFYR